MSVSREEAEQAAADLLRTYRQPAKKKKKVSDDNDADVIIWSTIRYKTWNCIKLVSCLAQLTLAAQYTARNCELDNLVDGHGQLNPNGEAFANENEPVICKMLNTLRQTTQSQLRDVAVNWLLTNNRKELPPAS